MKRSSFIKKLLIIIFLLLLIFAGCLYFVLRTQSKDISEKYPYSEIVDKELITLHPCFLTYDPTHRLADFQYRLSIETFDSTNPKAFKLPIGTKLKIEETKEITAPVSGAKYNVVLGSVFVKELNGEVKFEFIWGENPTYGMYAFEKNYDIYNLAPWQKTALPYKYFWDGHKEPHDWVEWNKLVN